MKMKKGLNPLEIGVIVFGTNFVVSLLTFLNSSQQHDPMSIAYGSMTLMFLTLFMVFLLIKLKNKRSIQW